MDQTLAKPTAKRSNTQQLAWGVLLFSFAVFCVIIGAGLVGLRYFMFQSRVPLNSTVEVARGTPTLTQVGTDLVQTAVTRATDVVNGSVLTTNPEAQGLLTFRDPQHDNREIASVTVGMGSSLNLRQASRPRFNWSEDSYGIDFDGAYGTFDIFVPQDLGRSIMISFRTTLGPVARLNASGRYTLVAGGGQVQLVNYAGNGVLILEDNLVQPVPSGQAVTAEAETNQLLLLPLNNLLGNAEFNRENVLDFNSTADQVRPQVWRCVNNIDYPDEPLGTFGVTQMDGRPALRLFRGDNALTHGATRCWQGLGTGTGGLDVTAFDSVSIRATFKIASQSLSACGFDGSECPLMLSMDYIPANGGDAISWFHGFYASVDPNRFFPTSCLSCNEQHERITPNVWYTYESHNLFEVFAPEAQPRSILNLRFYASGHQYDVYVNEVTLVADQFEITPAETGG